MEDKECCACLDVKYNPEEVEAGLMRERWLCQICGTEFQKKRKAQQASSPDSLKPRVLEGIAYNLEYVDSETVVLTRCR